MKIEKTYELTGTQAVVAVIVFVFGIAAMCEFVFRAIFG